MPDIQTGRLIVGAVTLVVGLLTMPAVGVTLAAFAARKFPGSNRLWGNVGIVVGVLFALGAAYKVTFPDVEPEPPPDHGTIVIRY
jgi:hypothetical protein